MKPSELSSEQLQLLVDREQFSYKLEYEDTGPGKFEGNQNPGLTEALYTASLDTSWLDGECGASDAPFGWNGLMGRFILIEDSQGFVSSIEYGTKAEAEAAFETLIEATDSYWSEDEA